MKKFILNLCLLLSLPALSQTDPFAAPPISGPMPQPLAKGIDNAQVTIPYGELKELLKIAHLAEVETPPPPIAAVLNSAEYHLDISGDTPTMAADFKVRTFTDDWNSLPLFGGSPRIANSDDSASVVWREDSYSLLTNEADDFTVHLDLVVPAMNKWITKDGFLFCPSPANRTVFKISGVPPGKSVRLGNLNPATTKNGEQTYHLTGDEGVLNIYIKHATPEPVAEPVLPSDWNLHSQIMIRYSEGRLQHSAKIEARADSGSGVALKLSLPPNASRITLESDDIEDWQLATRTKEYRNLNVTWKTVNNLDRTLLLTWELPQSPLAETWSVSTPQVEQENESESKNLVAIIPVDGLELTHPEFQTSGEARRLPQWLRNQVGSEDSIIAEISGDQPVDLAAAWLPRLKTAQATVSLAKFNTRLVTDGSMLVDANYTVQHGTPLSWILELPDADQILMCKINNQGTSPIQREDNKIEFRLPRPTGDKGTTIHLCYSLSAAALDPVSGQVTLELPRTELFIHRLDWSLVIPAQYEPTAVQGNVQLAGNQRSSDHDEEGNLIRLKKELCRGDRPAVELYYQRKDLTTSN